MLFLIQPMFQVLPWRYRRAILRRMGISLGDRAYVEFGARFSSANVSIGDQTYVNQGLVIEGDGAVTFGKAVSIGACVRIITSHHDVSDDPRHRASWQISYKPVTVEDGAWVGSGATILPGCTVAEGCVIGAGSVVTRSTEPNGLYFGVPAKRVRDLPVGGPTAP